MIYIVISYIYDIYCYVIESSKVWKKPKYNLHKLKK